MIGASAGRRRGAAALLPALPARPAAPRCSSSLHLPRDRPSLLAEHLRADAARCRCARPRTRSRSSRARSTSRRPTTTCWSSTGQRSRCRSTSRCTTRGRRSTCCSSRRPTPTATRAAGHRAHGRQRRRRGGPARPCAAPAASPSVQDPADAQRRRDAASRASTRARRDVVLPLDDDRGAAARARPARHDRDAGPPMTRTPVKFLLVDDRRREPARARGAAARATASSCSRRAPARRRSSCCSCTTSRSRCSTCRCPTWTASSSPS